MGRPIKIQKYSPGSSISGGPVPIDVGFNSFTQLEDPVVPDSNPAWPNSFVGVVGGEKSAATSATYPIVNVNVNIIQPSGATVTDANGFIIRQKGARKYLVTTSAVGLRVAAGSFIAGNTYQIAVLGNTDWSAVGAGIVPVVGTIFTATAVGSGTGTVTQVGTCVLVNAAIPLAGQMSISYVNPLGATVFVNKLTNKFVYDYNNVRSLVNFFSNTGTEVKSGTSGAINTPTQQNILGLGDIDSQT